MNVMLKDFWPYFCLKCFKTKCKFLKVWNKWFNTKKTEFKNYYKLYSISKIPVLLQIL